MARTAGSGEEIVGTPHAPRPRHTGAWVLRTNTVSFYLRSRLVLDPGTLHVETPSTILGLVPIGWRVRDIPLGELGAVRVRVVVRPGRVLVAVALLALAWLIGLPWTLAAPLTAVALALLFLGVALGMRIEDRSGDALEVPVCVLQRGVVTATVRQIRRGIAAGGAA